MVKRIKWKFYGIAQNFNKKRILRVRGNEIIRQELKEKVKCA